MPKDGRDLQKLIAAIEKSKADGRSDLVIESPAHRLDKVTGKLREHDVLLTYKFEHHELVMALECRDRSRPIGTDAVEAFHTKCENTGIHYGALVSAKGFSKPAIVKAAFYNIRCLTLETVDSIDWCRAPGIELTTWEVIHTYFNLLFPEGTENSRQIVSVDGAAFTPDQMKVWAKNILRNTMDLASSAAGNYRHMFQMAAPPLFMQLMDRRVQAVVASITIDWKVTTEHAPFTFRRYADALSTTEIAGVAVATIPIGDDKTADLIISSGVKGISIAISTAKR